MGSNYYVLKELMKICLLSAFNLAGGIGKEIQGVERISSITVLVSYVLSRKLHVFPWCFRPCPSTAPQCVFDLGNTRSPREIRDAPESQRTPPGLRLGLEPGRSQY